MSARSRTAAEAHNAAQAKFWGALTPRYAKMKVRDEAAYQEKLRLTREAFPPDARVLEFGCGTGSTALAHAPHVGRILALDIAAPMIDEARRKAAAAGIANAEFRTGVLEDIPADPAWDAVLALNILHLVPDPEATLRHGAAMLKPGGILVSSTPCLKDFAGFLRPFLWVGQSLGKIPPIAWLTEDRLQKMHADAGLQVETRYAPGKRAAVFLIARKPG